ncbi:MAG: hydrogenase iron-sulfur subunit [Candidatus Cloacimonadia bacterium]
MTDFEPKIVCILCQWCTYAGADLAGTSRITYPPNGINIKVPCSSRVDPQHILRAFRKGADGVFIGGCHPGDCHYQTGNYKTLRRISLLKNTLEQMGINPERLRLEWISASEGRKFASKMEEFIKTIKSLGPLSKMSIIEKSANMEPHETQKGE